MLAKSPTMCENLQVFAERTSHVRVIYGKCANWEQVVRSLGN